MFGSIGGPELLLIFVLALLLFGPRKLPEIGRTVGKTLAEFKRATHEFRTSLEREVELEKIRDVKAELTDPLRLPVGEQTDIAGPVAFAGPLPGRPAPEGAVTLAAETAAADEVVPSGEPDAAKSADAGSSGGDGRSSR